MSAPRCIVEIRYGRLAGEKAAIEPGQSLRVGRTELADLAVPHDAKLSGVHFELWWDGARCRMRDLDSATGTRLGGEPVAEGEVRHGAWIQAGETDFMIYVEGRTPPRPEDEVGAEEQRRRAAAARAFADLREEAARAPLFAVLDAGRDDRILEILRESVERHQSLFEGEDGEAIEDVAPYLAGPMAPESRMLERLALEGWGKRWGFWCTGELPFREMLRHWRRFLKAELEEEQEEVYFRFYDPGVMRVFLSTCTPYQLQEILDGIEACMMESDAGDLARVQVAMTQEGAGHVGS